MIYGYEPYDVLQIERDGAWLDFSTLRTQQEGAQAYRLVQTGMWEGKKENFRIRRGPDKIVCVRDEPPRAPELETVFVVERRPTTGDQLHVDMSGIFTTKQAAQSYIRKRIGYAPIWRGSGAAVFCEDRNGIIWTISPWSLDEGV